MSKSGTIIIVDDNKGVLTAVQILLKNYFSKVVTLSVTGHTDHCDTRGNTGSGTIRYEFHFGHQYPAMKDCSSCTK